MWLFMVETCASPHCGRDRINTVQRPPAVWNGVLYLTRYQFCSLEEGHLSFVIWNLWFQSLGFSWFSFLCLYLTSEVNMGVYTFFRDWDTFSAAFCPRSSRVVYKLQKPLTFSRADFCSWICSHFNLFDFYLVPCANSYAHISFLETLLLNSRPPARPSSDLERSHLIGDPPPWYLLPELFLRMKRYIGHHTLGWTFTPRNFQPFRGFKKGLYSSKPYHFYFYWGWLGVEKQLSFSALKGSNYLHILCFL